MGTGSRVQGAWSWDGCDRFPGQRGNTSVSRFRSFWAPDGMGVTNWVKVHTETSSQAYQLSTPHPSQSALKSVIRSIDICFPPLLFYLNKVSLSRCSVWCLFSYCLYFILLYFWLDLVSYEFPAASCRKVIVATLELNLHVFLGGLRESSAATLRK